MNTETLKTSNKGRPMKTISWPNGKFTIKQVIDLTKMSKVTVYNKVKEALERRELIPQGKTKGGKGRPNDLFALATEASVLDIPTLETEPDAPTAYITGAEPSQSESSSEVVAPIESPNEGQIDVRILPEVPAEPEYSKYSPTELTPLPTVQAVIDDLRRSLPEVF